MKKNRKLNNKGYMLVEIILASAIAFALAYFMLELTLKIKNKNNDLMIATLMATDKTIISNRIMGAIKNYESDYTVGCSNVNVNNIFQKVNDGNNNKIKIGNNYYVVNEYATIGNTIEAVCQDDIIHINIPLRIKADNNNSEFDVDLYYVVHNNNV